MIMVPIGELACLLLGFLFLKKILISSPSLMAFTAELVQSFFCHHLTLLNRLFLLHLV